MKENTWYQLEPYKYTISYNGVYVIYFTIHRVPYIAIFVDKSEYDDAINSDKRYIFYDMGDRFPNWKENLIKAIFEEKTDWGDGGYSITGPNEYWNWGN